MNKLFKKFGTRVNFAKLAFFTWLFSFVLVALLIFFPFPIVSLKEFHVSSPVVQVGGVVTYKLHFKKHLPVPGTIELFAVNSSPTRLYTAGLYKKTGDQAILGARELPENMQEGIYHLEFHLKYTLTSFRPPIIYVWSSNSFLVERKN